MIDPSTRWSIFEGCLIQHGPSNDRVYLMKLGPSDPERVALSLIAKATEQGYSKVFAKVPIRRRKRSSVTVSVEARIPVFTTGLGMRPFLGFYLSYERTREENRSVLDSLLDLYLKDSASPPAALPDGFLLRVCSRNDASKMAQIYSTVFPSYPFPIHDPSYLRETMETHVRYFGIEAVGTLIALSSAEMDRECGTWR